MSRSVGRVWWFLTLLTGVVFGSIGYAVSEATSAKATAAEVAYKLEQTTKIQESKLDQIILLLKKR